MKKLIINMSLLSVLFMASCSNEEKEAINQEVSQEELQQDPLTPEQINQTINEEIRLNGSFDWKDASDHLLWSAVMQGNNILTVGYGSSDRAYQKDTEGSHQSIKNSLLDVAKNLEDVSTNRDETLLIYDDEILTVIDIKVEKIETIQELRKSSGVRYLEPGGYEYAKVEQAQGSSFGCSFSGQTLSSADYRTITPGAKLPWAFDIHRIPQAWSRSTGSGVTIGVVDTGLSPNQSLLNSNFNDGSSSGRFVQKYGTFVDSFWPWSTKTDGPNDKCGHGTSMASVATAPRNNDGRPVGVAYNANLVSYRAAKDVVLDGYHEQKGVANAFTALGNRSDVKIISMSMGHVFSVGRIKDAIRYANNRGKLIFCAAGTSTSFTNFVGVIFPASMSETVAVTGVEEGRYKECDTCHKGSKVDFTVAMERSNNNHIPVLSYYNGQDDYVGGSSVATATTAGIAALVWARHPSWSKSQVLNKLIQSAELYPNKSGSYGWGNINAEAAVQ
ncbi:S8 family peptidase [Flavobacteriaceae bacterium M23B6Z8]